MNGRSNKRFREKGEEHRCRRKSINSDLKDFGGQQDLEEAQGGAELKASVASRNVCSCFAASNLT